MKRYDVSSPAKIATELRNWLRITRSEVIRFSKYHSAKRRIESKYTWQLTFLYLLIIMSTCQHFKYYDRKVQVHKSTWIKVSSSRISPLVLGPSGKCKPSKYIKSTNILYLFVAPSNIWHMCSCMNHMMDAILIQYDTQSTTTTITTQHCFL